MTEEAKQDDGQTVNSTLLYSLARHLLNPDDIPIHKWAVKGAYLLRKVEELDPEKYAAEMQRKAV